MTKHRYQGYKYIEKSEFMVTDIFLFEIGVIGAQLPVLSLFGCAHDLHHHNFPMFTSTSRSDLSLDGKNWWYEIAEKWISSDFRDSIGLKRIKPWDIFKYAMALLGHDTGSRLESNEMALISYSNGQVLYPCVVDNPTVYSQSSYLQLAAFPGQLRWDGMSFDKFIQERPFAYVWPPGPYEGEQSYSERMIGPDFYLKEDNSRLITELPSWKVSVRDSILYGEVDRINFDLWRVIAQLGHVVTCDPCSHNFDRTAGSLGRKWMKVHGAENFGKGSSFKDGKGCNHFIITNGSQVEQLQVLASRALQDQALILIYREGCIRCALELCEEIGCKLIMS